MVVWRVRRMDLRWIPVDATIRRLTFGQRLGLGAPAARRNPTSVWTGSRMLVWGGIGQSAGSYS